MALVELSIRNFAIIKHVELELDAGLTVVTGETGAGKSIVLDALGLLLGTRADSDQIRTGEEQCEITALFSLQKLPAVKAFLNTKDLTNDDPNYCLIRRILRRNKPTKCYVNDQPTTLASLKELGFLLVDLHGQHEHQSLLRSADQRRILDQFADHPDQLNTMATLAAKLNRLRRELASAAQQQNDAQDRLDLLSFQLDELLEADIQADEFEQLEIEHARLNNARNLLFSIAAATDTLVDREQQNISSELGRVIHQLQDAADIDPKITEAHQLLQSALAQVEEAAATINQARAKIEQNPERLQTVEQRRDTLIELARKHRCAETDLVNRLSALQSEFDSLKSMQKQPEQLQQQITQLGEQYFSVANEVSNRRQAVALQLSAAISDQMQELGMRGGKLEIRVTPKPDSLNDHTDAVSENGIDQIHYLVSTNFGVPLKPLHKTASGGELSRISLAIQVITSAQSDTPTLVFDEVDVGIGGKVAQMVGARLRKLGRNAQVICITHQPQVAAQGDHHLFVEKNIILEKNADQTQTVSTLAPLELKVRTAEIARMLSGREVTERTLAHAQELLDSAISSDLNS